MYKIVLFIEDSDIEDFIVELKGKNKCQMSMSYIVIFACPQMSLNVSELSCMHHKMHEKATFKYLHQFFNLRAAVGGKCVLNRRPSSKELDCANRAYLQ